MMFVFVLSLFNSIAGAALTGSLQEWALLGHTMVPTQGLGGTFLFCSEAWWSAMFSHFAVGNQTSFPDLVWYLATSLSSQYH